MRSYSDTSSTTSSDEGYGYYEMNKFGGRYGRKYATLAASSVSRRRAKSRNDRFYEAQRSLWKKGDISSNDSFEKTAGSSHNFKDINKLTAAAFSEALKKHFSAIGSRNPDEENLEARHSAFKSYRDTKIAENIYVDEPFSSMPVRSEVLSGSSSKKTKKTKRRQKYYHKSSESILQSTPSSYKEPHDDTPPELPPRNPTNTFDQVQIPPPVPPYPPKTGLQKSKHSSNKADYNIGHLSEGEALSLNRKAKERRSHQSQNPDEFRSIRQPNQLDDGYFKFSAKHIDEVFASLQKHNRDSSTSHTSPSFVTF